MPDPIALQYSGNLLNDRVLTRNCGLLFSPTLLRYQTLGLSYFGKNAYFVDAAILAPISTRCAFASAKAISAESVMSPSNPACQLRSISNQWPIPRARRFDEPELSTMLCIVISTSRSKVSGSETTWGCQYKRNIPKCKHTRHSCVWDFAWDVLRGPLECHTMFISKLLFS